MLTPIGVLAPGSAHTRPSALPPSTWAVIFCWITIREVTYKFSDLYLPGMCSISYMSLERHHGVEKGCWRFMRVVLVEFDVICVQRIHPGSSISIFKSLPFLESGPTPGCSRASSKCHPWILRGHSWEVSWLLLTYWMSYGYIKKVNYKFSDFNLPGMCSISYVSPERNHGVE